MTRLMMIMPYQAIPPRSQRIRDWATRRGFTLRGIYWDRRGGDERGFTGSNGEPWEEVYRGGGEKRWQLGGHYPRFARRVYDAVRNERPDIVLAFDLDAVIGALPARREHSFHLVYDVADTFYLRHPFPRPVRRVLQSLERIALEAADLVMVPDPSRITPVEAAFKDKIEIVYNCPSRSSAPDVLPGGGYASRERGVFLLSGYLTAERGCHTVLAAASLVPEAKIVVAGHAPDASLRDALTSHRQVEFHGIVSHAESAAMFARSQAVFTFYDPRIEINRRAASNKWYDAMMTRTPIIANSELVNAPMLQTHDLAYLVPYGDAKALADCMCHLIANPDEGGRKGAAGWRLFDEEFNWERMEERLDAAFVRSGIDLPVVGGRNHVPQMEPAETTRQDT